MRHVKLLLAICFTALAGCATKLDLEQTGIAKATHADLQAAAAYASANGYPARAAVWTAIDAQLKACNDAITAAEPAAPASQPGGGIAYGFEVAAEAAGNVSGVPSSVKLNCAPLPLIVFPSFPVK